MSPKSERSSCWIQIIGMWWGKGWWYKIKTRWMKRKLQSRTRLTTVWGFVCLFQRIAEVVCLFWLKSPSGVEWPRSSTGQKGLNLDYGGILCGASDKQPAPSNYVQQWTLQLYTTYNFNAPLEQKRTAVDPASALQIMARKLVWKATLLGLGLFGSCVQAEQKGGQIYNILCMLYLENRQNIYWS